MYATILEDFSLSVFVSSFIVIPLMRARPSIAFQNRFWRFTRWQKKPRYGKFESFKLLINGRKFGELVRRRRGVEAMTQQQLAVLAFGDESHKARISELENGRVPNPQSKTVDALIVALNFNDDELSECRRPELPEVNDLFLKSIGISVSTARAISFNYTPRKKRPDEKWSEKDRWQYEEFLKNTAVDIRQMSSRVGTTESKTRLSALVGRKASGGRGMIDLGQERDRLASLETELALEALEGGKRLAVLRSKRALADAHLGELDASISAFSECLRILVQHPASETRSERSEIAGNILSASKFYKNTTTDIAEEYWKLAASEVLNLVHELAEDTDDPQQISELLRALLSAANGADSVNWLVDAVEFLDASMVRYMRANQYTDAKFDLLMLRAELVAYIDRFALLHIGQTETQPPRNLDQLLASIGSENLEPKARALVELQQARSALISSRGLRGPAKTTVVRSSVEAFRRSYEFAEVANEKALMAIAATDAAEASSELYLTETNDDNDLYFGVLYFSRAAEALSQVGTAVRVNYAKKSRKKSLGKAKPSDILEQHDLFGELMKREYEQERIRWKMEELLTASKLQKRENSRFD